MKRDVHRFSHIDSHIVVGKGDDGRAYPEMDTLWKLSQAKDYFNFSCSCSIKPVQSNRGNVLVFLLMLKSKGIEKR